MKHDCWNEVVPIGATYRQAVSIIVDASVDEGWITSLVEGVARCAPSLTDELVVGMQNHIVRRVEPRPGDMTAAGLQQTLMSLLERMSALPKQPTEARRLFTDMLAPLFRDLELVHRNYVSMFEELLPSLEEPQADRIHQLTLCAEVLRRRRIEFEPVRNKLGATIRILRGGSRYGKRVPVLGEEADRFLDAVVEYFPSGYLLTQRGQSAATALYVAIRTSSSRVPEGEMVKNGDELLGLINDTVSECRRRWISVAEQYTLLELSLIDG